MLTPKNRLVLALAGAALCAPLTAMAQAAKPSIQIVSPKDEALVEWGDTLTVEVKTSPAVFKTVMVAIAPFSLEAPLMEPPYRFTFRIPRNVVPGVHYISAIGASLAGEGVGAEIRIDVESPVEPMSIRRAGASVMVIDGTSPRTLVVDGRFADGTQADLTLSKRTKYVSDHPEIATVDDKGHVTPLPRAVPKSSLPTAVYAWRSRLQ